MGGATPGGVATHQFHLAQGLAEADVDVALLATNASAIRTSGGAHPFSMYAVPCELRIELRRLPRLARYVLRVGRTTAYGSRREVLRNLVAYADFVEQPR